MKDLIILGNGMAGMTAALYAKRANLDFEIIGKDEFDFGQIGNAILVDNYPCAAGLSGFDLAMKLHDQLEANKIQIEEHEVQNISLDYKLGKHYFVINYADGTSETAKTVIYALGAAPRKLNCKIDEGIPIHYCALCDGSLYKDKTVAVIGGGDVAFTQAEYLSKICKEVNIVMCDENITAAPSTVERIKKISNIHIEYNFPTIIIEKRPDNGKIQLFSKKPGSTLSSWFGPQVDGIFVAIGMKPNFEPVNDFYIIDYDGYILANENCITSLDGFFAAGDIRKKQVRQALTAAADGAVAVQSAINYLKEF